MMAQQQPPAAGSGTRITVTIRRRGMPTRRITGIWPSTTDAVASAIDLAGNEPCSISARAAQ